MGPAVIQEQDIEAVGERLREGVDEELERVGVQIGQFQEKPVACGRGDGTVDGEPFESVLDQPHGLDPRGGQSAAAHGQEAHPTFILAEHAHWTSILRRDDLLQALPTARLKDRNGVRVFLCD
jgi:hypothetical protein